MTPAAPASSQPERPDAFISYSRQDGEFVRGLVRALEARGKDVWVDLDDIPKSADWLARVEEGIEAAKAVVVVLSPALAGSQICGEEIRHAIEHNKRLIPILRGDVEPEQLYPELNAPNWILARDQDDREAAVEELIEALETDLAWLEVHARLVARSVEWDREDRDSSFLLRGDDLKTAQRWLAARAEHREQPTELQVAYIGASRRSAVIRRAIVGVAAVGVLALAGFLLVQRDRAQDERERADLQERLADSRRLSADALGQLDTDPRKALATALEAHGAAPTPEATHALRQALMRPRPESTLRAPGSVILSAEFSDENTVRGQTIDGEILRWQLAGGDPVVVRRGAPQPVYRSHFPASRAANLVARPGLESVRVATSAKGTVLMLEELRIGEPGNARSAALSPDGRRMVTSGYASTAHVWRLPARVIKPPGGARAECAAAARAYTVTCDDRGRVQIWPTDPLSPEQTVFDGAGAKYDDAWDLDVGVSTEESRVFVTSQRRGTVAVIGAGDGQVVRTYKARRFSPPVLSGDGRRLLVAGKRDAQLKDASTRELITSLPLVSNDFFAPPVLDSTGERVAIYLGDGVRVWNVARRIETAKLPPPKEQLSAFAISPSGKYVSVVDQGVASTFRSDSDSLVVSYPVPGNTRDMDLSRDDAFVVTAGKDLARVWESKTGRPVASFGGHHSALISASFGPSARTITTVGLDGVAIVHDCPACAPPAVLVKRARAALRVRP